MGAKVHDPDLGDFERVARSIGLAVTTSASAGFGIDADLAAAKLHAVCRERVERGAAWRPIGPERAGKALDVTAEERWACGITTMGAVDETRAERAARLTVERRGRDRLRKRLARAEAKEMRAERIAREVDVAQCQKASKLLKREDLSGRGRDLALDPWQALGISRRTWFRRRKAGAELRSSEDQAVARRAEGLLVEEENLTDPGRCQPVAAELVSSGGACDDEHMADFALRRAARRSLEIQIQPEDDEDDVAFLERREAIERDIAATVGRETWRAMLVLLRRQRLTQRTFGRVLADAGLQGGRAAA